MSILGRYRVRFARFADCRAATRDIEVCQLGCLGDRFGRFPGCVNVSASTLSAAGRGKLSGRRRRSSKTDWQKGKFDVIGQRLRLGGKLSELDGGVSATGSEPSCRDSPHPLAAAVPCPQTGTTCSTVSSLCAVPRGHRVRSGPAREPHQLWSGRGCRFSCDLPGMGATDLRFPAS